VLGDPTAQRVAELLRRRLDPTIASPASVSGSLSPAITVSIIRRPLRPMTSERIE
jgi:hypothetical protein